MINSWAFAFDLNATADACISYNATVVACDNYNVIIDTCVDFVFCTQKRTGRHPFLFPTQTHIFKHF